ncbi:MAG: CBS domain-containing protein [Chitinophagaceae bacterium]
MTFCSQLLDTSFQTFDLHDTVSHALEMMDMHHAEYAVVLDGLNYLGLLDIVDMEEADPSSELIILEQYFIKAQVKTNDHFLQALRVKSKFNLNIIPVLNEKNEWEGIIKADTLLEQTSQLLGASTTGAFIVLEIPRIEYAPGQINRLVESNDCMIMQMNTMTDPVTGMMQVVIRVNKEEVSDLIAPFQRHEYNVLYYYGDEAFDNTLQNNLDHLLNYLNI